MDLPATPFDVETIARDIMPFLPDGVKPADVAVFPRDNDNASIDIVVNSSAVTLIKEHSVSSLVSLWSREADGTDYEIGARTPSNRNAVCNEIVKGGYRRLEERSEDLGR
jgi:hypothetical protein